MRRSKLFTKTLKNISAEENSINAQLLTRGGFIYKNSAGIYSFLPLGWRVAERIAAIIRHEMKVLGACELFMPALIERKYFETTGRFNVGIAFDVYGKGDKEPTFALGWTHEEVVSEIASHCVSSYKDLPFAVYQIQTKFRNEARARSGLLRAREFLMKDLYSFHTDEKDFLHYYGQVQKAYFNIFKRCGLSAYYTLAAGGEFTKGNTHEFQVLSDVGEDTIFYCANCKYAENSEISKLREGANCKKCSAVIKKGSAIEVGNIFPLGTKYSQAFNLYFSDRRGGKHPVIMGSYGIGIGRVMGAVVQAHHDDLGIIWPESIAPFKVHLISLLKSAKEADKLYKKLLDKGVDLLYDDRKDTSAGEKFAEADLLGIPTRVIMSEKSLQAGGVEVAKRANKKGKVISADKFLKSI